jgi:UDP-glucose 4-epimerase
MRILVLGGAGYIGTQLVSELAKRSDVTEIIIYDNLSRSNFNLFLGDSIENPQKVKLVQGELLDSRNLQKVLEGTDVVYHLAAKVTTPFANTDPHFYEQVNHWGTAELVYALEESNVKKFIYTSSTGVYGSSKSEIDARTIPNPRTFYGTSKLRGEEHVRRLKDRMETYIMRCGNVYGFNRSMRFDAVINKFVFEANFNRQVQIHGDGRQHRAFIHIRNVAAALSRLLDGAVESGTYNLVDRNTTVLDIVDTLKMLLPDLEFIFINQHLTLRQLKVQQDKLLAEKLGLKTDMSFEDELKEFLGKFSF